MVLTTTTTTTTQRSIRPRPSAPHLGQLLRLLCRAHHLLRDRLSPRLEATRRAKVVARGQETPQYLVDLGMDTEHAELVQRVVQAQPRAGPGGHQARVSRHLEARRRELQASHKPPPARGAQGWGSGLCSVIAGTGTARLKSKEIYSTGRGRSGPIKEFSWAKYDPMASQAERDADDRGHSTIHQQKAGRTK